MQPTSVPVLPPLPSSATYGPEQLQIFTRFNRGTYMAKFGQQAPPWDKSKPIKRWFHTGAASTENYLYFNDSAKQLQVMTMSAEEAASINLPGSYDYPAYVIAPTPATIISMGSRYPVRADVLSAEEDARGLADILQRFLGPVPAIQVRESDSFTGVNLAVDWGAETRRAWTVVIGSQAYSVGLLLRTRNLNGVGAPGVWNVKVGLAPTWAPASPGETGEQDIRPEVPIPCRALQQNESIRPHPLGPVYIYRNDMPNPFETATGAGGGFSDSDRNTLTTILNNTQVILANTAQ